jgi:hypothetical protein
MVNGVANGRKNRERERLGKVVQRLRHQQQLINQRREVHH